MNLVVKTLTVSERLPMVSGNNKRGEYVDKYITNME